MCASDLEAREGQFGNNAHRYTTSTRFHGCGNVAVWGWRPSKTVFLISYFLTLFILPWWASMERAWGGEPWVFCIICKEAVRTEIQRFDGWHEQQTTRSENFERDFLHHGASRCDTGSFPVCSVDSSCPPSCSNWTQPRLICVHIQSECRRYPAVGNISMYILIRLLVVAETSLGFWTGVGFAVK